MTKLYFRCNGGHYFTGSSCPYDGWRTPEVPIALDVAAQMQVNGEKLELSHFVDAGISRELIRRIVLVEFGDAEAAFDAIDPSSLLVDGKDYALRELDARFL